MGGMGGGTAALPASIEPPAHQRNNGPHMQGDPQPHPPLIEAARHVEHQVQGPAQGEHDGDVPKLDHWVGHVGGGQRAGGAHLQWQGMIRAA